MYMYMYTHVHVQAHSTLGSYYCLLYQYGRASLKCIIWLRLHLCEECHLEHVPDVKKVHARLANQEVAVSLHVEHLVVVVMEGSLVQLLFDPGEMEVEWGEEGEERWGREERETGERKKV